jgi:hypothetical protein
MRLAILVAMILTAVALIAPAQAADPALIPLSAPSKAEAIYGKANAPATPKLEDLPLKGSLTQYGITWTFEQPVRAGQFVGGDYYVVGPATVKSVTPLPLFGEEVKDATDAEKKDYPGKAARNGSVLNLSATGLPAYDSRTDGHRYDPKNFVQFPVALKPGDALISTISVAKPEALERMMGPSDHKNVSTVQGAAVLTCVEKPLPPDAFRPSFCDRSQKIYLARDLKRDLLPKLAPPSAGPKIEYMTRVFERPWIDTVFFGFCSPVDNLPQYGREIGRAASQGTVMLCCDFDPLLKERLLQGIVQAGIDYWGVISAGHPGYQAWGGHGQGRKWIIVFSGIMLGDADMQNPYAKFPKVRFSEDMQTVYGDGWTGAHALYGGHVGAAGDPGNKGWGLYENKPPETWEAQLGEGYRHCCTSIAWVGQALAIHLLHAEKIWNHDAFLDYCDRWMYEDNSQFLPKIKAAKGWDFGPQGKTWDGFVDGMWSKYRTAQGMPPTDGWQKPHPSPASAPAAAAAPR